MAFISVTYTFSNATVASAAQVNQNLQDLISGLSDASKDLSVAALTTAGATTLGDSLGDVITFNGAMSSNIVPKAGGTRYTLGGSGGYAWRYLYLGYTSNGVRLGCAGTAAYAFEFPDAAPTITGQMLRYNASSGYMEWTTASMDLAAKGVLIGNESGVATPADTSKLGTIQASYVTYTFTAATASGFLELTASGVHGLANGSRVMVSTTGALPTGLSASTVYYVAQTASLTLQLSTASTGHPIVYTDAGTGTHTLITGGLQEVATAINKEFLRFAFVRSAASSAQYWAGSVNALASDASNTIVAVQNSAVLDSTANGGMSWTSRTSQFTADHINAVAHNQTNLWVAVGAAGKISASADAATWVAKTSGVATALNSVAYGDGIWVAVGASGVILASSDGTTWVAKTSGVATALNGVTYGAAVDLWVAVGDSDVILTSADGTTWAPRTSWTTSKNLVAVKYANGVYVVAGGNELLGSSANGTTWVSRLAGAAFAYEKNCLASNGSIFVAASTSGNIHASPNGCDWTALTPNGTGNGVPIKWVYDRGQWIGGATTTGFYTLKIT